MQLRVEGWYVVVSQAGLHLGSCVGGRGYVGWCAVTGEKSSVLEHSQFSSSPLCHQP